MRGEGWRVGGGGRRDGEAGKAGRMERVGGRREGGRERQEREDGRRG